MSIADLSDREKEVLRQISNGRSTKEIAAAMNLAVKTIETHRRNLMAKVGFFSVAQLTKLALREGLTTL